MSKIFVHDLMTISRVFILIIGQNDINPKLPQPIVASICKVMVVKKPCVQIIGGWPQAFISKSKIIGGGGCRAPCPPSSAGPVMELETMNKSTNNLSSSSKIQV